MPNRALEEENIDGLLAHFRQHEHYQAIREWLQRIENKEARLAHRTTKTINVEQAVEDFRRVLLSDTQHSESAKALLRKLNRPAQPKFTAVEAWRLQNPANRPITLTPEQQGYVDRYDQRQRDRAKVDVSISEVRQQNIEPLGQRQGKPALTFNPPLDGKCSRCKDGLMDVVDHLYNELGVRISRVWGCINCSQREYQQIHLPKVSLLQRPDDSRQADETLRGLSSGVRHFMGVAKEKEAELKGNLNAGEKKRVRKQQLVLLAVVDVLQRMRELYDPVFADAIMDAHAENPITPLYSTYELLMLRAEKHGLGSDHYIQDWLYRHKKSGDKAALGRARRGLQKKVSAPYSKLSEMEIDLEIIKLGSLPSRTIAKKLLERGFVHNGKPLSHVSVNERRGKLQKQLPWFRPIRPNF